jgi:hypothetical protein
VWLCNSEIIIVRCAQTRTRPLHATKRSTCKHSARHAGTKLCAFSRRVQADCGLRSGTRAAMQQHNAGNCEAPLDSTTAPWSQRLPCYQDAARSKHSDADRTPPRRTAHLGRAVPWLAAAQRQVVLQRVRVCHRVGQPGPRHDDAAAVLRCVPHLHPVLWMPWQSQACGTVHVYIPLCFTFNDMLIPTCVHADACCCDVRCTDPNGCVRGARALTDSAAWSTVP